MSCIYCRNKQEYKKVYNPSKEDYKSIVRSGTTYYENEDGEAVVLCNTCNSLWSIKRKSGLHDPRDGGWGDPEWELYSYRNS